MEENISKDSLAKKIAGEIVLSPEPGKTIQKWRNLFKIPQRQLATELKMMPSVISDYENGRRKSPGINIIKRIVDAMLALDDKTGGKIIREFSMISNKEVLSEIIVDSKEFSKGIAIKDFCRKIGAELVVGKDMEENKLYGYTIIDVLKAIIELSPTEMVRLYGLTNEKALIFKGASSGRSSIVGLKAANVKPGLVILHTKEADIDPLAKRIAQLEMIPVALLNIKDSEVKSLLKSHF